MDRARVETRVDEAISRFGVTGRGVLLAILDRGIDWRNNDFRNSDGSTRIAAIYDLTDDTGSNAPANPYGYGTIYSRQQINDALQYGTNLVTRDAVGHGTTTAGIAGGNGRNLWKYRGVAFESTLLIVKFVTENIPAHDNQPAEKAFYDPARLPAAVRFCTDQAKGLGMPCVMLLNIGSIGGPTDGTSAQCKFIDSAVGAGIPGLVFVTGSSDDGGIANHAGGTVPTNTDATVTIHKGSPDPVVCDIWYAANDRLDVSVETPDSTLGPYLSPRSNNDYDIQSSSDLLYYHYGAQVTPYGATARREAWLSLRGRAGDYAVRLHGAQITDGHFDACLNPSRFWDSSVASNYFTSYVVPGYTLWDVASASNNICPNDYVIRTNWVDTDGIPREIAGQGSPGELWPGSGIGPTYDGRTGIDVSAPGESVFTTYNTNSWWGTFRFNLIQDGGGLYGRASAVSAANPIVTGIVALILQMNPHLDATEVKRILHESARRDSWTGTAPNPRWGYGKVDAYEALRLAQATLPSLSLSISNEHAVVAVSHTSPGRSYTLQRSTDLAAWSDAATMSAQSDPLIMTDPDILLSARFYRVKEAP